MCEEDKDKKCENCGGDCSCGAEIEQDLAKEKGRECESPSMDH